jgi:hypothetical protein
MDTARTLATRIPGMIQDLFSNLEEHDWTDISGWDELPEELVLFLGDQEGLRVDRQPISSRQDLERAFYLLHIKGDPQRFSIVTLAFRVLFAYGQKISRPRKPSVDLLLVMHAPPQNIVPRKCLGCGRRVLDDSFAYYAKGDITLLCYMEFGENLWPSRMSQDACSTYTVRPVPEACPTPPYRSPSSSRQGNVLAVVLSSPT